MGETLPLFPLGTVLFPGVVLPLHIFEERYRRLVRDLLAEPEPRQFGVIAIRKGRETGVDGVSSLFSIGCTATLRRVSEYRDGRFDLVTVGTRRFRLRSVDDSGPYLRGEVDPLPEDVGDEAEAALVADGARRAFVDYLAALTERGATVQPSVPELPDEPMRLSYLIAAAVVAELADRQALLAQPDAVARLRAERALLSSETSMLRAFTSAPAPGLRNTPWNPN
jgi:uncharacterized protein